ncbi:MAG: hypothetical protein H0V46_04550 [Sphingomonas sp.]|nr:hypothetical protein [Sphingomonas sp.]
MWALKESGALTEEEFARLKAKALGTAPHSATDTGASTPSDSGASGIVAATLPKAFVAKDQAIKARSPKGCWIGIALAFLLLVVVVIAAPTRDDTLGTTSESSSVAGSKSAIRPAAPAETAAQKYKAMLKREIASMRKQPRLTAVPNTKTNMLLALAVMGARAKSYKDFVPPELDEETKRLRVEYRSLAIAYQRDAFPKLRKAQAKLFANAMWEQNIEVAAIGQGSKILRFIGALFANNQAIAVARDSVADTISLLRFDQDRYEWYRGSEYTYFKRSALSDATFADFTGTAWEPIES